MKRIKMQRDRVKTTVRINLDADVLAKPRKSGEGWQERFNELIKAALGLTDPLAKHVQPE